MSKGKANVQHGMQGVFVFVLLGLFALMSTLMVLLGAQMYRGTVDHSAENNAHRVLGAYVRSMVRAEDAAGAVRVEEYDGVTALAMTETIDGDDYVTWIYQYDGSLYEQFTDVGYDFDPAAGTPVCAANAMDASIDGSLLTVRLLDDRDEPCTVQVALRCAA